MKPYKYIIFLIPVFTFGKIQTAGRVQKSVELNYTEFRETIKKVDSDLVLIQSLLLKNRITALKCSNGTLDKEDREFLSGNFFENILTIILIRKTSKYKDRVLLDSDYPLWPQKIVLKNKEKKGLLFYFLPVLKPGDFGLITWVIKDNKPAFNIKSGLLDPNTANLLISVMDQAIEAIILERRKIQSSLYNMKIMKGGNQGDGEFL